MKTPKAAIVILRHMTGCNSSFSHKLVDVWVRPCALLQVVIFLVLLTWWLDVPKSQEDPFKVIEFFAGAARIASIAKSCGFRSAAVDIEYGKSSTRTGSRPPMDLNSCAGLMLLNCI